MREANLQLWKIIRSQIIHKVNNLEIEKLYQTPRGLSNNLIWIFGHLVRTRDFLILKISNHSMNFPEKFDSLFAKGSSPKLWQWKDDKMILPDHSEITKTDLWIELLTFEEKEFNFLLNFLEEKFQNKRIFENPYQTSLGFVIDNFEKVLHYILVHESIHLGQIQIYEKLL